MSVRLTTEDRAMLRKMRLGGEVYLWRARSAVGERRAFCLAAARTAYAAAASVVRYRIEARAGLHAEARWTLDRLARRTLALPRDPYLLGRTAP